MKLTKFVFQELTIEKKEENATIVTINQMNKSINFKSTELEENSFDIDPLFGNPSNNSLSFEKIEPLLYFMPISELNLKENPSPIMKNQVFEGEPANSEQITPILINLKTEKRKSLEEKEEIIEKNEENGKPEEEKQFFNQITQNRFNNIRIFSNSVRGGSDDEKTKENEEFMRKLELLKEKEEAILRYSKMADSAIKIQCFYRKTLFLRMILLKKNMVLERKVSTIKKKGELLVWLKIFYDFQKKSHYVHASFIERFGKNIISNVSKNKNELISSKKTKNVGFKIDIPKELALKILDSQEPFVWVFNLFNFFLFLRFSLIISSKSTLILR